MTDIEIDFDANLNHPEHLLSIFAAYNKEHIEQGTPWSNWPEWELCLTTMIEEFHYHPFESSDADVVAEAQHWLAFMEFLYNNPAIHFDNYTIHIKGLHGNSFSFDFCLSSQTMTVAGTLEPFLKKNNLEFVKYHFQFKDPFNEWTQRITHSRGEMWVCPDHVAKYGGQSTEYTFNDTFCFQSDDQCFPAYIKGIIHLCIDDNMIWKDQFEHARAHANAIRQDMEQWPFGRPEDAEYQ